MHTALIASGASLLPVARDGKPRTAQRRFAVSRYSAPGAVNSTTHHTLSRHTVNGEVSPQLSPPQRTAYPYPCPDPPARRSEPLSASQAPRDAPGRPLTSRSSGVIAGGGGLAWGGSHASRASQVVLEAYARA